MRPFVNEGFVFVYEKKNYCRGDIVVYRYEGKRYIHRIVDTDSNFFIISNDDDIEYHKIEKKDIEGAVVGKSGGVYGFILHVILKSLRKTRRCINECFR